MPFKNNSFMKFMQNILRSLLFTCFLLCGQEIFGATACYVDLGPNGLNSDTFKQAILSNNRKPFKIRQAYYGSIIKINDNQKLFHASTSPAKEITTIMQQYADKGLFAIPTDFAVFLQTPRRKGITGIWVKFKIDSTQNDYTVIITQNSRTDYLIDPQNGKKFIAQNEDDLVDSLQEENITQEEEEDIITVPPSGPITLDALDAYLKTISTTPTFKIKNGCWYGAKSYFPSNLTDIVQQSLQQHADKGLLAFPANMNQYFGKDPIPAVSKFLHINFTMNAVNYSITIPENNAFSPKSKYLYKIPEGAINPLLSTQQNPEPSEDLTAYLAQFNTKEEIEAEIKRIKKEKDDMIWAREHIGMTETVLIKFNAKMDEFNAKIKKLQDKLATIQVPSQPEPSSPWPPAGAITLAQLKLILETNNQKPFKIIKAVYGAPGKSFTVSDKLQVAADSGQLYIPENMNAAFGDPIGGVKKNLDIIFTMNQQEYKLTLGETWFASSPEWFKQPNQYILLKQTTTSPEPKPDPSSPWPPAGAITLAQLKTILEVNNKKPFKITEAVYGAPGKSFTVTEKLQAAADSGQLYIPKNLNAAFGDPKPGIAKLLIISFTMNQQIYTLTLGENWFTSSPEWFKQPNQYILLKQTTTSPEPKPDPSSPWPPAGAITLAQLKTILEVNNKKPFKITEAVYGAPGKSFTVTEKLQAAADSGQLYIPKNLNAAFGDPKPGIAKLLIISFTMNQQIYTLTLGENWFTSSPEWFKQPNQYILLEQATQSQSDQNLSSSPLPTADAITIDELKPILEENKGKPFTITEALYGELANPQNIKNVTQKFQNIADLGILYLPSGFIYLDDRYPESKQLRITFAMNQKNYSITINDHWTFPNWCMISPFIELSNYVSINFAQLKTLLIKNNKKPFEISLLNAWLINQGGLETNEKFTGFNTLKENASRGLFLNPYTPKSYNNGAIKKFDIIFTMLGERYQIMDFSQRQLTSEEQLFHDNYFIQY